MLIAGTSHYGMHCATMTTEVFSVYAAYSLGSQHLPACHGGIDC
jgi:hypothetical protein